MKTALITGITGQDGAYLSEFLLKKGYTVHGIKRRSSLFNTDRIDHLYQDPHTENASFFLHYGDMTDSTNLIRIIQEVQPDEIYNLAAMSHVQVSFDTPEYTANADGIGMLRLLEAIRILGLEKKTKIYQASTSELYGLVQEVPQTEKTPFYPRSPYAVAKLYAYWITVNYREAYNMFACNGILFNHESPIRGETFVTRKITRAVAKIALGLQDKMYLGNLDAQRDWGHAKDYVRMMWMILQAEKPEDWVIATGITTKVRDFVKMAFQEVGIELEFKGEGAEEKGYLAAIDEKVFIDKVGEKYLEAFKSKLVPSSPRPLVSVEIWGSGKPMREFLWSEEMADACVYVMENVDFIDLVKLSTGKEYNSVEEYKANNIEIRNTHINIGTGKEISIKELAELVKKTVGFRGELYFNTEKPDGTMRKLTDVTKLHNLGWHHKIDIEEGIEKMVEWYVK